jgi:para-nitrobenzyl esterase
VVVVTVNYRLGAFGLFAHPALTAEAAHRTSGNYAFADSLAALEWVRRNIAAFGGDPQQVTLMGQSAGGRLIQSLRTSPCARGLFRRAIVESAPIRILAMRTLADAERDGLATAEKVVAPTLGELRALPPQQVLENFPIGQPVIDGRCITQDPLRALESGPSHDVDLLVGSNEDEGTFPFLRAREFSISFASEAEYSNYVHERYADGEPAFLAAYPAGGDADFNARHRAAFRDEMAWLARFSASAHARSGHTYLYYFMHKPPAPPTGPDRGSTHGAEISYAFGTPAPNWRDEDRRVADVMSAYWANFATRGDPNGPGLPMWPRFTAEQGPRMNLGPMTEGQPLDAQRIAIFDALYRRVIGRDGGQRSGE